MMDLELLSVLAEEREFPIQRKNLSACEGDFVKSIHDILPGSAIHEVYEVTKKEYEELLCEAEVLKKSD